MMTPKRILSEATTLAFSTWLREPGAPALFQPLLLSLIVATGSRCGFIGEVRSREAGAPHLDVHASENLDWSGEAGPISGEALAGALSTAAAVLRTGPGTRDPVIPGLPVENLGLQSLLGLPLACDGEVVGVLVLGDRPEGYDDALVKALAPTLTVCGGLMAARRRVREGMESEAAARAVLDSVLDAVIMIDEDGCIESVNPAAGRMFGYAPSELLGRNVSVLMTEPDRSQHDGYLRRYHETGIAHVIGVGREVIGRRRDGSVFPLDLAVSSFGTGAARRFTGILRDITERKRAEAELLATSEALAASETRMRLVIDTALDAVIAMDAGGRISEWNAAAERIFGWPREEAIGRSLAETIVPPALRENHRRGLARYQATGEGPVLNRRVEIVALRRDGQEFPVELAITPLGAGPAVSFSAFVRDITDRLHAEKALRTSEERYRLLLEHSLQGVYIHLDGIVRLANPAMARMHGFSDPSEMVGQPYWIVVPPEERPWIEAYRQARLSGETAVAGRPLPRVYEARSVRKDGTRIWVEISGTVIPWNDGQAVMATFFDITERKRAEEALRESEERLALAVTGAELGVWDWNPGAGTAWFSEQWCAMLGIAPSEIEPSITAWESRLHPEDAPGAMEGLRAHLAGQTPVFRSEHRLRSRDGSWRWVTAHGEVVARGPDGRALRMVGIQADISLRKEAEQALQTALDEISRSHGNLLAVLNQLRVAIAVVDASGTIAFLSERFAAIEGLELAQAVGRTWNDVLPFDERSRDQLRELMRLPEQERTRRTLGMQTASGRVYHLECDVRDDPRDASCRIIYLYDVTEVEALRERRDIVRSGDMVGASPPMVRLFETIQLVAPGDWVVLIEGETGVGKELVARAIHTASPRRRSPFIALNCAGLTESLVASQLFGHRRGAFTGAVADQEGMFEAAAGGTLFLDEIGDLPLPVQTSLLRVLQEREITRVGEPRPRKIDVRVLAATHRDLAREAAEGRFREDLLYRLRVARITVPALRERAGDIPLLVSVFLAESRVTAGKTVAQISTAALRALESYTWPGNVRELRHAIQYAVIHCHAGVIQPVDLPPEIQHSRTASRAQLPPTGEAPTSERERIVAAIQQMGGNRKRAAQLLGMSRATLYRRLEELGISERHS